ncbi:phage holin family protein [Actinacidiphila paucisporea]|uniref:Putative Holin-X, holin superfamily III n=1 Tax=Actinacidiphila paucisporea TaxID=310782 RepID=A0A1M7LKZ5_9ACTN|nr:phage holin family protein [Actinacidiphila paucisporea]SHM78330.1 Putative Holin-X, holin superfamily III [Actinacidiphila paucisporea]
MALSDSEHYPPQAGPDTGTAAGEPSLGELISDISSDLSQLVRNEIELAKAELKQESVKAGKAGGMLAGAGYAGHLAVLLASLTVVFALGNVMDLAWAALIVTAVWAIAAGILYVNGRKRLRAVKLKPDQTVETLKEDARWVRNPTN